ncbi:integrase core domain-containing protein [Burkholderia ambifaria]|nr:integrase core domain-containing protein [Burkholderia ambifaria]
MKGLSPVQYRTRSLGA